MSEPAAILTASGIWKRFSRGLRANRRYGLSGILHELAGGAREVELRPTEFWALKDVDLEIQPGGSIGLLGANGAGKTTLLRILAGISRPDRGSLTTDQPPGALLDPTASFNSSLSGYENVHLAFSILEDGRSPTPAEVAAIDEFADIGRFMLMPLRTYSSGMRLRLAFAILINLNRRLLLIDEAILVGDTAFQRRCLIALRQHCRDGGSLIFASHSLALYNVLANAGLYLKNGVPLASGSATEVATAYLNDLLAADETVVPRASDPVVREARSLQTQRVSHAGEAEGKTDATATNDRPIQLSDLRFVGPDGGSLIAGEPIWMTVRATALSAVGHIRLAITFWTPDLLVCVHGALVDGPSGGEPLESSVLLRTQLERVALNGGRYACRVAVAERTTMEILGEIGFDSIPMEVDVAAKPAPRSLIDDFAGQPLTQLKCRSPRPTADS